MSNVLKKIILSMMVLSYANSSEIGIVDTDILLIKKYPTDNSAKFGFYKINKVIKIQSSIEGIEDGETWYKTKRGYVKANYVVLEKDLPRFISSNEIDYSKNALQLIVYQNTVVESLQKLRKILKNEKYLYLEKSKNVFVIYIANFSSYKLANQKRKEISRHFSSAFITKIKDKRTEEEKNIHREVVVLNQASINEPIINTVEKDEIIIATELSSSEDIASYKSEDNELISKEELDSLKNNIEEVEIYKPKKRVDIVKKDVVVEVETIEKDEEVIEAKEKEMKTQTYQSILENLLIFINKK